MTEEIERYRIEQARAWLERVRALSGYERTLRAQVDEQLGTIKAVRYDRDSVQTSPTDDAVMLAAAKHIETAELLAQIADEAAAVRDEAVRCIAQLSDPRCSQALQLYYIGADRPTWEQVCVEMSYSYAQVMRFADSGLSEIYGLMPARERDSVPRAL